MTERDAVPASRFRTKPQFILEPSIANPQLSRWQMISCAPNALELTISTRVQSSSARRLNELFAFPRHIDLPLELLENRQNADTRTGALLRSLRGAMWPDAPSRRIGTMLLRHGTKLAGNDSEARKTARHSRSSSGIEIYNAIYLNASQWPGDQVLGLGTKNDLHPPQRKIHEQRGEHQIPDDKRSIVYCRLQTGSWESAGAPFPITLDWIAP